MHHDPTFWILARASGLTAYALLTLSVLAGLVLKARPFGRPRAGDGHRGAQTLALTGARCARAARRRARARHDGEGQPRRARRARARRLPAGCGRRRRRRRLALRLDHRLVLAAQAHRAPHLAAPALATYALFGLATVHGITAGTDTTQPWARASTSAPLGSVVAATAWRALVPTRPPRRSRKEKHR